MSFRAKPVVPCPLWEVLTTALLTYILLRFAIKIYLDSYKHAFALGLHKNMHPLSNYTDCIVHVHWDCIEICTT